MTSALRQRGQAMAEFVIGAALFLVPIFLIIPIVGKYIDVNATNWQAARYAAWERTVWYGGSSASVAWPAAEKSDAHIENEIKVRLYGDASGAFKAADKDTWSWSAGPKALWTDRAGTTMLQNYSDIGGSTGNSASPSLLDSALSHVDTALSYLGSTFRLEYKGRYTAAVSAEVAMGKPIPMSLDGSDAKALDLGKVRLSAQAAVMGNGWNANGGGHTKTLVNGLAPLSIFDTYGLSNIFKIFSPFGAEWWFLELGKNDVDIVPSDRLADQ
jgi:hypothetical protein